MEAQAIYLQTMLNQKAKKHLELTSPDGGFGSLFYE
jgi:hypothetical protein